MATAPVRMASSRTAAAVGTAFLFIGRPSRFLDALAAAHFSKRCHFCFLFLSSIVPQDGTVHNVLYRYLFRTIFLFRPRAPAAPCSRNFLLSYCSTPPLKRKIKFSLQTVPFVPTPAAFFFGGGRGCYPAHIFCRSGAAGVGIRSTVFYRLYCYRRHSLPGSLFYTSCYPAHNSGESALESPAQFTAGGVVIGSTISVRCASRGKKNGCYRTHNSDFFLRAAGCYPQHNLRGG